MPVWTHIDDTPVNGSSAYRIKLREESRYRSSLQSEQRIGRGPRVTGVAFETGEQQFLVERNPSVIERRQFEVAVRKLFSPSSTNLRTITATREIDDVETDVTVQGYITELRQQAIDLYAGVLQMPDPHWLTTDENSESTSPVTVSGNIEAQPTIEISGGDSVTRVRHTFRDRTGHGVSALLRRVSHTADAMNTRVFYEGRETPFRVVDSYLWVRIDIAPSATSFIDIYSGASINNQSSADELDPGGIDLSASTNTTFQYDDEWRISEYPLSAAGSWRPGIVTHHPQQRNYTFGMIDNNTFQLVDREAHDERVDLQDDADGMICIPGIEIESVDDLSVNVRTSFNPALLEVVNVERQNTIFRLTWEPPEPNAGNLSLRDVDTDDLAGSLVTTLRTTGSVFEACLKELYGGSDVRAIYSGGFLESPVMFEISGPYQGVNIPVPEIVTNTLNNGGSPIGDFTFERVQDGYTEWTIQHYPSRASAVLYSQYRNSPDWIPRSGAGVTAEIPEIDEELEEQPTGAANRYKKVIRSGIDNIVINDVDDIVALYDDDIDSDGGVDFQTKDSDVDTSLDDAVALALAIVPTSTKRHPVNDGRMSVFATSARVNFNSSKTPQITTSDAIDAYRVDGVLTNTTTGDKVQLTEWFIDDTTLAIDTLNHTVETDVGPVYMRALQWTDQNRWWTLPPGENAWDAPGSWNVTLRWNDRYAV